MGLKIIVVPRHYAYWITWPCLTPAPKSPVPSRCLEKNADLLCRLALIWTQSSSQRHPLQNFPPLWAPAPRPKCSFSQHIMQLCLSPQPKIIFLSFSTYRLLAQASLSTVASLVLLVEIMAPSSPSPKHFIISIIMQLYNPVVGQIYPILMGTSFTT